MSVSPHPEEGRLQRKIVKKTGYEKVNIKQLTFINYPETE